MTTEDNIPQLDKVNEILQSYVEKIGVDLKITNADISEHFNYTQAELRALDQEECYMIAGLLTQKAALLQTEINRHTRIKNWANDSIEKYIVDKLFTYDKFIPYDVRKTSEIQKNEYTQKLSQLIRTTQLHIDTLQYIPTSLKTQADFFINLAKSKRKYNEG
jgi:hypothetical protein